MRSIAPRRGFTLIELIVVVAVIGIVLSIALPTLGRAREGARVATSMKQSSQLFAAVSVYANDHRGLVPTPPAKWPGLYFSFAVFGDWDSLLHQNGYVDQVLYSPYYGRPIYARYSMSCSLLAQPDYWLESSHFFNPLHLRTPVKLDRVRFPSRKIALHDRAAVEAKYAGLYRGPRVIAAFVDGHAAATDDVKGGHTFAEAFFGHYADVLGVYHYDDRDRAGQHTWNGVYGWDVEGG